MIPIRKLYHSFTTSSSFVFAFPAAYDVIQMMWKFTGTDANDTINVQALERRPDGTVLEFEVATFPHTGATPPAGSTGEQIALFEFKVPAIKVTYVLVGAGSCEVMVKAFNLGLQDSDTGTKYPSATAQTDGMFATWGAGATLGEGT